ncbi:sulfatase-like hydrolase/transferase [Lentisphaera profundi]|uniref:Sulfatase-like hydrolase/transferase n=1 Tax=Lentisphaera profundi TaxID=1658616 RepID=A0ABY7VQK9_9BACT|nr:sulfatase-like hydrolase/transferase [Lentisphaera profundi]WDE96483.1 sulfatase-like hydrolase/transferase [Lentisphaera profundi]
MKPLFTLLIILSTIVLAEQKPNFIFIMADDMGFGDLEAYGHNTNLKTPHLNAMATNGMLFNNFYSQAPVCSPTRFSCYTGRHPFRTGIWEANQGSLRDEEITLPEVLKKHGYRTGHFGKWHLGQMVDDPKLGKGTRMPMAAPQNNGVDDWFAVHSCVPTFNPYGPESKEAAESDNAYYQNGVRVTENMAGDSSRIIMDRALPFIKKAVNEQIPFSTYIWFNTPHAPVSGNPEWQSTYEPSVGKAWQYYSNLADMDKQVGRLRAELKKMGIADNTMLCFTSDNGPVSHGSAGPFRASKRHLFDGGIHVPGIIEWPARVAKGSKTDAIACTTDYFLTALEAAGIDYHSPHAMDGQSLLPILTQKENTREKPLLFQSHGSQVVLTEKFKAMRVYEGAFSQQHAQEAGLILGEWGLFDRSNDEGENKNIASAHPEVLSKSSKIFELWDKSLQNSYLGKEFGEAGQKYADGSYRSNGGLKGKSQKKNKKSKSGKKSKKNKNTTKI